MREQQHAANAGQSPRQSGNNNERIEPRLKIDHNQEISKNDRAKQTIAQSDERAFHRLDLAANDDVASSWQTFCFDCLDALLHLISDAAEIAPIDGRIYIDHRLAAVVRDLRGARGRARLHKVSEDLRRGPRG